MARLWNDARGECLRWAALVTAAAIAILIVTAAVVKPADATDSISVEAEQMTGAGKNFSDKWASNDRARVFYGSGSAYKEVQGSFDNLLVRARGDRCKGAPRMVVTVGGKTVMSRLVRNEQPWRYYSVNVDLPSGWHKVVTRFTNDHKTSECNRSLRVDNVTLKRAAAVEPIVSKPLALGVYNPSVPYSMDNYDNYVAAVGDKPGVVLWMQSWGPREKAGFCASCADNIVNEGASIVLTWISQDYTRPSMTNQSDYSLSTIIDGKHDDYIRQYARGIAGWGGPIKLRFDHEMNGNWSAYSTGMNGNQPGEYVAAWKHVHRIFQEEGATNVKWVWSPNAKGPAVWPDNTPLSAFYPGDAYVDWVALDGYNWGTGRDGTSWHSFEEIFGPSYKEITALTNKPLMIAETGSCEPGGDKAAWIREAFLNDIPNKFPRIKAVNYWNNFDKCDLQLTSSSKVLDAWRDVATSARWQGELP